MRGELTPYTAGVTSDLTFDPEGDAVLVGAAVVLDLEQVIAFISRFHTLQPQPSQVTVFTGVLGRATQSVRSSVLRQWGKVRSGNSIQ